MYYTRSFAQNVDIIEALGPSWDPFGTNFLSSELEITGSICLAILFDLFLPIWWILSEYTFARLTQPLRRSS